MLQSLKPMNKTYTVLGVMAGSSMDGLDVALIDFILDNNWHFTLRDCATIAYPRPLFHELKNAPKRSFEEKKSLDIRYGTWIGKRIKSFLGKRAVELIAVHGHTVLHEPSNKISWQLGSGKEIAGITGIQTVTDFRTLDVSFGGQGAPLVPLGDFELFGSNHACLNLGGIANISIKESKTAWDIAPCNQVLNYYASRLGIPYDDQGKMARKGKFNEEYVKKISFNTYFNQLPPKSLQNAFIPQEVLDTVNPHDGLSSYCHFLSNQITKDLVEYGAGRLLVTGGGAFNTFLIELISGHLHGWEVILPKKDIVSYKEAIIFGFLGVKKIRNEINVLHSVTGSESDSVSGVIHFPE